MKTENNCTCDKCVNYRNHNPHKWGMPEWKKNLIVISLVSLIFGVIAGVAQFQQSNALSGLIWGTVIYALSFVGWYVVKLIAFR